MGTFYVSCVQRNFKGAIKGLCVHENAGGKLQLGTIRSLGYCIQELKLNHEFYTVMWDYSTGKWKGGSKLEIVVGAPYIQVVAGSPPEHRIENLIDADRLIRRTYFF